MAVTTSCHVGSTISFRHNARDRQVTDKENHIKQDGYHYTFRNSVGDGITLRDKYDRIFGEAVEAYNSKQKRDDRKITSYYDKIKAQQIKGEQAGNKSSKKLAYEMILTIGDYTNYNPGLNKEQIDPERAIKLLKQTCHEIIRENPHLKCVGVYIHADEYHKEVIDGKEVEVMGAPHAHFDFIPTAEGYKKGLSVQNGLNKALQQDGYTGSGIKDTPQMAFQRAIMAKLDAKAKELGLEVTHPIRDGKVKAEHLDKNEYIIAQQVKKLAKVKEQAQAVEEDLTDKRDEYDAVSDATQRRYDELEHIKEISDAVNTANENIKQLEPANDALVDKLQALEPIQKHLGVSKADIGKYKVLLTKDELDDIVATKKELHDVKQQLVSFRTLADKVKGAISRVEHLFRHIAERLDSRENELDEREIELEKVMSGQRYQEKKAEVDKENKLLNDITDQRADSLRELLKVQRQLRDAREELGEYKAKKRSYYEEQFLAKYKDEFDEYVEEEQERFEREEDEYYL